MSQTLQDIRDNFSGIKSIDKDALLKEKEHLEEKRKSLLACENESIVMIEERLAEIYEDLTTNTDFPILDTSFLKETVEVQGFKAPKFSFIPVERSSAVIQMTGHRGKSSRWHEAAYQYEIESNIPSHIRQWAHNIINSHNEKLLSEKTRCFAHNVMRCWKSWVGAIACSCFLFSWWGLFAFVPWIIISLVAAGRYGNNRFKCEVVLQDTLGQTVIPDSVKQIIKANNKTRIVKDCTVQYKFDHLWLMKEATWDVHVNQKIIKRPKQELDPLLLGEKDGKFYVLDCFDLTPAEEYIKREFATIAYKSEEDDE